MSAPAAHAATRSRWVMLGAAAGAQTASTAAVQAAPFLIPYLHLERGLDLVQAGVLASAPLAGVALTLVPWGWVADVVGERRAMVAGLALVVGAAFGAAFVESFWALGLLLVLVGTGAASANSASGRVVVGWFPPDVRGLAMGIRQAGQPLGVGFAALIVPNLAASFGLRAALLAPAAVCVIALVVVLTALVDPPRPTRAEAMAQGWLDNPYRGDRGLVRIHMASTLLVVPQTVVASFALVWLIDEQGFSTFAASAVVAGTQVLGSLVRVASGWWSDRAGSRLRPMRLVAVATAIVMVALGALESTAVAVAVLVLAAAVTVASNGLAFTAVAERGGPYWSGRTIGVQNTGQYLSGALVTPLAGAAVTAAGYGLTFGLATAFPLAAIFLIPSESIERCADFA